VTTPADLATTAPFFEGMPPSVRRVVVLICQGETNKGIAYELGITERTVRAHMSRAIATLTERGLLRYEDSPRPRMAYLMGLEENRNERHEMSDRISVDQFGNVTVATDANGDGIRDFKRLQVAGEQGAILATEARTATVTGATTGTISDPASGSVFVTVTSDDANKIIVLPTPTPGTTVALYVAATGYELRTSAPASIAINGGSGANAESAIPASTLTVCVCVSATAWRCTDQAVDGSVVTTEPAA
jgi:hypothetical protein